MPISICTIDIQKLKEAGIKLSVKEMIYDEFLNILTNQLESGKINDQAYMYLNALEKTFREEQKFLFDKGIDLFCDYWAEKEEELLECTFAVLSSLSPQVQN